MVVTSLNSVTKTKVDMEGAAGVIKQLPIGSADGAPNFSFRVFTVSPGGHTPYHQHESEHVNYVISGKGVLVKGEKTENPIQQGDFCLVAPYETHQFQNRSKEDDLVIICAVMKQYE